jgi:hypothetical protein
MERLAMVREARNERLLRDRSFMWLGFDGI